MIFLSEFMMQRKRLNMVAVVYVVQRVAALQLSLIRITVVDILLRVAGMAFLLVEEGGVMQ